jgi:hypothetical protein
VTMVRRPLQSMVCSGRFARGRSAGGSREFDGARSQCALAVRLQDNTTYPLAMHMCGCSMAVRPSGSRALAALRFHRKTPHHRRNPRNGEV